MADILPLFPPQKREPHAVLSEQVNLYRMLAVILRDQGRHRQADDLLKGTYYISKVSRELSALK